MTHSIEVVGDSVKALRTWAAAVLIGVGLASVTSGAMAADPATTIEVLVAPTTTFVGDDVTATATMTYFGSPVQSGSISFYAAGGTGDFGETSKTAEVVDGRATITFNGGLVSGARTMTATYNPDGNSSIPSVQATAPFEVRKNPTTTAVSVTAQSQPGQYLVRPSTTWAGGAIVRGECATRLDGVLVNNDFGCVGSLITASQGPHTVTIDYTGDPFGVPSDSDKYAPSSGSATFTVPAPPAPVVSTPAPAQQVATTVTVATARKSVAKKARRFTVVVSAADGRPLSGTVFLTISGPRKVSQKLTFTAGRATASVALKKVGTYRVQAKVVAEPGHTASKSPVVRFKVVPKKK